MPARVQSSFKEPTDIGLWEQSHRIFKCLGDHGRQSVRRLAQQTGLSKRSVHRLTQARERRDTSIRSPGCGKPQRAASKSWGIGMPGPPAKCTLFNVPRLLWRAATVAACSGITISEDGQGAGTGYGQCCITSRVALWMGRHRPRAFSGERFPTSLRPYCLRLAPYLGLGNAKVPLC